MKSFFKSIPILFFWVLWIFVNIISWNLFYLFFHRFGLTISSSASNRWPLVAVSHQMTVRDAVPLQEQSDGLISQIQGS